MGKMSRNKGKTGEREVVNLFKSWCLKAFRTAQACGMPFGSRSGVADVDLQGFHIEVKRTETAKLHDWFEQFNRDRQATPGFIMHRKNGGQWMAIVPMDMLFLFLEPYGAKIQLDSPDAGDQTETDGGGQVPGLRATKEDTDPD